MALGAQEQELIRRMVAQEIRRQMSDSVVRSVRQGVPVVRPVRVVQAASGQATHRASRPHPRPDGTPDERAQINRAAHLLADTQVRISQALEGALKDLDDLVTRAETTAEKIRSALRRTEPSRQVRQPGGP